MPETSQETVNRLVEELREAQIALAREQYASRTCTICGALDDEENGFLTDFRILISDGEEGHSDKRGDLCEVHLPLLTDALVKLGLGLHVHGGVCFLEDTTCPGAHGHMKDCPTPEEQFLG